MRDRHHSCKLARSISPVSVANNTAQVGQVIDAAGFDALEYEIAIGAVGQADSAFAVTLDHGDASNALTPVAAEDLLGTLAGAGWTGANGASPGANGTRKVGYRGTKRYTRLTITPSSNDTACLFSAIARLDDAKHQPLEAQAN